MIWFFALATVIIPSDTSWSDLWNHGRIIPEWCWRGNRSIHSELLCYEYVHNGPEPLLKKEIQWDDGPIVRRSTGSKLSTLETQGNNESITESRMSSYDRLIGFRSLSAAPSNLSAWIEENRILPVSDTNTSLDSINGLSETQPSIGNAGDSDTSEKSFRSAVVSEYFSENDHDSKSREVMDNAIQSQVELFASKPTKRQNTEATKSKISKTVRSKRPRKVEPTPSPKPRPKSELRKLAKIKTKIAQSQGLRVNKSTIITPSEVVIYWNHIEQDLGDHQRFENDAAKIVTQNPDDIYIASWIRPNLLLKFPKQTKVDASFSSRNQLFLNLCSLGSVVLSPKMRYQAAYYQSWIHSVVELNDNGDVDDLTAILKDFESQEVVPRKQSPAQREFINFLKKRGNMKWKSPFHPIADHQLLLCVFRFIHIALRHLVIVMRADTLKTLSAIESKANALNINTSTGRLNVEFGKTRMMLSDLSIPLQHINKFMDNIMEIISKDENIIWWTFKTFAADFGRVFDVVIRLDGNLKSIDLMLKWKLSPSLKGRRIVIFRHGKVWNSRLIYELMQSLSRNHQGTVIERPRVGFWSEYFYLMKNNKTHAVCWFFCVIYCVHLTFRMRVVLPRYFAS